MAKFNDLLNLRLRKKSAPPKMGALAERSNSGNLSSFSGVFRVASLSDKEKSVLSEILNNHKAKENVDVETDFDQLVAITSEVKSITNQAVLLHGERIQKAQKLLKNYEEGAFTAWLIAIYGNRQTPYNFLKYYEFYTSMPQDLHQKIDTMPRQAIYTLASRDGDVSKKEEIVKNYEGQAKNELITMIRKVFPLQDQDRRNSNMAYQVIQLMKQAKNNIETLLFKPSKAEQKEIETLIKQIKFLLKKKL